MNLLADENIETEVVQYLRNNGYTVDYVLEMSPGIKDRDVIEKANKNNSLVMTSDKDFGELVFRQGLVDNGVILLRLHGLPSPLKANIILSFLKNHGDNILNAFSVITPKSVRVRSQLK